MPRVTSVGSHQSAGIVWSVRPGSCSVGDEDPAGRRMPGAFSCRGDPVRTGFFFSWLQSARLPSEEPDTHSVPVTYATQSMACPYPLQDGMWHSATLQACSRCILIWHLAEPQGMPHGWTLSRVLTQKH